MTQTAEIVQGTGKLDLRRQMSVDEIRARVSKIREIKKDVMKDGAHYGTVGNTNKPTLLKAGSEILLMAFCLAPDPLVEDLSNEDEVRYRVKCDLKDPAGNFVGAGVGEGSSSEEKYKWRRAVCQQEYDETPADRRRKKWFMKDGEPATILQVRTNPSDVANTILKMAKKRAQVDAALTALSASEEFTQDVEDMDPAMLGVGASSPAGAGSSASGETPDPTGLKVKDIKKLKTGEGGKGPWTLYGFEFSNGQKATSFNDDLAKKAARAKAMRLTVAPVLVPSKGKNAKPGDMELSGLTVIEAPAAPAAQPQPTSAGEPAKDEAAPNGERQREPGDDDLPLLNDTAKSAA